MSNQAKEKETRVWATLLHLSMLSGYLIPFAGFVAPIIIWQIKKDELPAIDVHGKNAANWLISLMIYFVVASVLSLLFIGIPLIFALITISVVFPIIGAIRANNGEIWQYPLSLKIIK